MQKRSGGDSSGVSKEKKPEEGGDGGKDAGELFGEATNFHKPGKDFAERL